MLINKMSRKQKITREVITFAIAFVMTVIVLWLRSGDDLATQAARIEYGGVSYSVTDLYVILAAGICGYKYGIMVFLAALVEQALIGRGVIDGLFSLMIYFVISIVAGYISEKRWYTKLWKTLLAALYLVLILGGSWFIVHIQLYSSGDQEKDLFSMCLGAVPEVLLAVLVQYLFFGFLPDKMKMYVGKAYVYTKDYECCEEFIEGGHSVLRRQVTLMTMSEALVLSVFAVILSNAQMSQLSRSQRERMEQQRILALSEEQMSGYTSESGDTTYSVEITDSSDNAPSDQPNTYNHSITLSDEQIDEISNHFTARETDLIIMDIQLGIIVMCIAMPLGMFFNNIMVRRVVLPIRTLSSVMNDYFSEKDEKREALMEKLKNIRIKGKNNEINQLNTAMQRMIDDMTNYINAVEHEKELEAELKVAEARSEAKSLFLSNMSHEIRTPINAILGMNEMILRESHERSTIEYAENVRNAGNTLLGLVNDILDFSKIESGKMDIIPVDYDLASLLNDLVTMIQTRADAKGLKLVVNVDSEIPVQLHGDEIRIKQVATNILTNAVKYTEKGSVTLTVGYEKLPPEDDNEYIGLRFTIADTGIGIKPEDMSKLFTAFERIEEERNRTVEGTGLGMNITRRLLDMMGSELEVSSVYGEGSTFAFTLKQLVISHTPIGNYEESYRRTLAERKRYRESFTAPDAEVLVVDDTKMNLTVFANLLKKTLVKIDTACSGDECLRLTAKKKYDIIFLDHRMPEKDGIETLKELLTDKSNPNIGTPMVCLTANAVSGAREMYISAGFADYLTKPIDPDHLEAALKKYLPSLKVRTVSPDSAPEEFELIDETERTLPKWLLGIGMIDAAEGIRRCGDPESYIETLKVYTECAVETADEIERYWKMRDIPDVTVKVHALKSTSRVIGAMRLGDFAERMEKAGNDGDTAALEKDMDELITDYRVLAKALSPLTDNNDDESGFPMIPEDKLKEAYDTIRELSVAFDYDSVTYVMESLSEYRVPEEEKERFSALKNAVSNVDWDTINNLLG